MKIIYSSLIALLFVLSSFSLEAQNGFLLGVDGSYNIYSIVYQNNYGQKMMDYKQAEYQFIYGVHVGYKFNHRHQLRIGIQSYKGGQSYADTFTGRRYEKSVSFSYLGIPIIYRFTTGAEENDNNGIKFFVDIGPMISFLREGSLSHVIDKQSVSFNNFYLSGGNNPTAEFIREQALTEQEASDATTFFNSTDILARLGFGMQAYLSEHFMLSLGLNGVISISDINKKEWRIPNDDGAYNASRNSNAGVNISLSYLF